LVNKFRKSEDSVSDTSEVMED